jgi:hypothetical protein
MPPNINLVIQGEYAIPTTNVVISIGIFFSMKYTGIITTASAYIIPCEK